MNGHSLVCLVLLSISGVFTQKSQNGFFQASANLRWIADFHCGFLTGVVCGSEGCGGEVQRAFSVQPRQAFELLLKEAWEGIFSIEVAVEQCGNQCVLHVGSPCKSEGLKVPGFSKAAMKVRKFEKI